MRFTIPTLLLFFALCCSSCTGNKTAGTTKDLQKIYGRKLLLPTAAEGITSERLPGNDRPKIVIYYNSDGCQSCRIKELGSWKVLLNEAERAQNNDSLNVDFIFIFKTEKSNSDLLSNLNMYKIEHPVLCDSGGEFERKNLLPEDDLFHTFLLDKDNKVALVGTPIYNPKLWGRYKGKIAELNR